MEVHEDADVVQVVTTLPPAPSAVAVELTELASGLWGMVDTKEVLPALAERARQRFCVMTPFIDEVGAPVVKNLFERSRACAKKSLVIRATPEGALPSAVQSIRSDLDDLGVQILSLRKGRTDAAGYETFHAKVILADEDEVYVGSANMTRWSFEQSLELGVLIRGKAAQSIARLVDAVASVSTGF
ncbi:phospholipase D-like domain-containing protein [Variovorax sp. RA8]|uniref:phospholipase D-like domain-containing protein n=1 Tax=Variovorax sp. (strain JCM 16519 / RA8) TaxID=662548 RepID=UPI0013A56B8C|nr:phospholipase D-like domain-containing protein [Variovorax sp. RA8]